MARFANRSTDESRNSSLALTLTLSQREKEPESASPVIWCDPSGEVYPPALASLGFDLTNIYLLHPQNQLDESWAITECLRCRGVGAVIASPQRLTRIEARRLQLAAETGGTVALLLRQRGRGDSIYAAATRWLVQPYPGERTIQRWTIQLLHGHGGRIGQTVFLEWCRETNSVRAVEKLSDRQVAQTTETQRATA
jgi:protein ImuA